MSETYLPDAIDDIEPWTTSLPASAVTVVTIQLRLLQEFNLPFYLTAVKFSCRKGRLFQRDRTLSNFILNLVGVKCSRDNFSVKLCEQKFFMAGSQLVLIKTGWRQHSRQTSLIKKMIKSIFQDFTEKGFRLLPDHQLRLF